MKCASAASSIVHLLRAYHRAFSIRRAPYLISYATYVAATIHSRIAAKRAHDSTAHNNLATCLAVFRDNQETNSAVKKASMIVQSLMKRLGVVIEDVSYEGPQPDGNERIKEAGAQTPGPTEPLATPVSLAQNSDSHPKTPTRQAGPVAYNPNGFSPGSEWMDIDGIIQSFLQENDGNPAGRIPAYNPEGDPSQVPKTPWPAQGGPPQVAMTPDLSVTNHPQMPMHSGAIPPPDADFGGAFGWQQGWRGQNGETAESLEDPLFGFNGSSLDSFNFMGW
jgi:hypothetical protein